MKKIKKYSNDIEKAVKFTIKFHAKYKKILSKLAHE